MYQYQYENNLKNSTNWIIKTCKLQIKLILCAQVKKCIKLLTLCIICSGAAGLPHIQQFWTQQGYDQNQMNQMQLMAQAGMVNNQQNGAAFFQMQQQQHQQQQQQQQQQPAQTQVSGILIIRLKSDNKNWLS